eukprot:CAMPEP_0171480610 /NCGR_PEP_ID=MMETSP0946-20130122/6181_1 /TAXON_ID=109269 /ORGANISM="Vaucheria litorea, Strain CCMP2940" /LENGTH=104 /DNA_ID=CAMNT_0012011881 /DNA_START=47 /DNA_END=357 /DNA_ORIENTATION=-
MPLFKQCDDFGGTKLLDAACLSPVTFFIQNWCCQCVTVGQMQHKIGDESFLKCCLLGWCCAICTRTINRGNVRKKLGVDGNLVEDLIITWCCPCCAISQEARAL